VAGEFDVIIVGAGPAGIFAALELTALTSARILILEKGVDLPSRLAGAGSRVSGWGGAGAFSDGKLNLSPDVGGNLGRYLPREDLVALIGYVDGRYREFGAPKAEYSAAPDALAGLQAEAACHGLSLIPTRLRHLGTERCPDLLARMRAALSGRVEIGFGTEVARIEVADGSVQGVTDREGNHYRAPYVILAAGRDGADWLAGEARRLGLPTEVSPVDIGVRVELPAVVLASLTDAVYEAKLYYTAPTFDDQVRTFCMCPYGEVIREEYAGLTTVNGHSYAERRTANTNFAVLVSTTFTEPFREPVAYGQSVARLANLLGGHVLVQRLGDLRTGRRSTPERIGKGPVAPSLDEATPGDLSFALPYRHLTDILEMLEAMDRFVPGVNDLSTLLYGVEVKFYSLSLRLSPSMETAVRNLFAVGDGSGVSRGLVQSSASGVLAAREAARRLSEVGSLDSVGVSGKDYPKGGQRRWTRTV
jgi:uncharacterized FAD-dependent dehydrogenase